MELSLLALEWQVVIDFLLGASFVYLLVRRLTGSRWGGVAGGLAFTLGGFLTAYPMQQLPILETAIWLPLALYCIERAWGSRRWLGWMSGAGLAMGISLLAGHPQTWMLAAYTCLAYILWKGWVGRFGSGPPRRNWWQVPAGSAVLLGIAGGVAAVQLLPTLEFMPLTVRQPLLLHEAGHGYDYTSLVNTVLPLWRNERGPYIGILALLLAGLALVRWRNPTDSGGSPHAATAGTPASIGVISSPSRRAAGTETRPVFLAGIETRPTLPFPFREGEVLTPNNRHGCEWGQGVKFNRRYGD